MIFVTVGTQKFQFDRLFKKLDELKINGLLKERIIGQSGSTKYKPRSFYTFHLSTQKEMDQYINECEFVITHAGTGSIIQGLRSGKKVLVVPRRKEYGEHVDDHQIEIAKMFEKEKYVESVYDINDILGKIRCLRKNKYNRFQTNNHELLSAIENYIDSVLNGSE